MEQELVSVLERLIAELGKTNNGDEGDDAHQVVLPPVHVSDSSERPINDADPLHRQIPREDGTESVIWDYSERVSDGYKGQDGGAVSEISKVMLVPREDSFGAEAVIGDDDRAKVVNSHEYPWRMIVALEIQMPGWAIRRGTGFMVGPTTVLTAGHCVYEPRYGGWAEKVTVQPGLSGAVQPFGSLTSSRMSTSMGWVDLQDHKYDYALIELDEPIGERTGWFSVGVLSAQSLYNSTINVCGYPTDVNDDLLYQWHSGGEIAFVENQKLYYEADTFGGTSGGPVWLSKKDGTQVVVGIHAYGTKPSEHLGKPHNSATRVVPEILRNTER